jgi:hypothetical protein
LPPQWRDGYRAPNGHGFRSMTAASKPQRGGTYRR